MTKARKKQIKKSCACRDCGKHGGNYMLKNDVWFRMWPTYKEDILKIEDIELRHGMLCIRCAEKRWGKKFTSNDFMPGVPCNDVIFYGLRGNEMPRLNRKYYPDREICSRKSGAIFKTVSDAAKAGNEHNRTHGWSGWGYAPLGWVNNTVSVCYKTPTGIEKFVGLAKDVDK
jgi:hypothetical protein